MIIMMMHSITILIIIIIIFILLLILVLLLLLLVRQSKIQVIIINTLYHIPSIKNNQSPMYYPTQSQPQQN